MSTPPAPVERLAEAHEAAEHRAAEAAERLRVARQQAAERAARFAGITTESHIEAAQIRALADQVRLEDPAIIEAAAIEAAQANLTAVIARYEALEATGPALQAELDRREAAMKEATEACRKARMDLSHTQPIFNGKNGEIGSARQALEQARRAAQQGAEERLASLTGIRPTPPPIQGDNVLSTHTTYIGGR